MAATLVKFLGKVGLATGAVYVTASQGIWDVDNGSLQATRRVKQSVLPEMSEYMKTIPSPQSQCGVVMSKWNTGVQYVFGSLSDVPETTKELSKKAVTATNKLINSKS